MRLRKLGHSCIRLEQAGKTLVIDPGSFSAPDALEGANAVLITHEHVDHVVVDAIRTAAQRTPDRHIWTTSPVADALLSEAGLSLVDRWLGPQGPGIGAEYRRLGANEALDVAAAA